MRATIEKLLVVSLLACSEPHDFDLSNNENVLNIVDARISNIQGRSYIDIYLNGINTKRPYEDLNVTLVNDLNEVIPFVFDQTESNYRPQDPTFAALRDRQYKLEAYDQSILLYESTMEQMASDIDFKFAIEDTTLFEPQIDGRSGLERIPKAFVARISPATDNTYLKFDFKYSFADFFTGDSTTRSFLDDFVLFSNDGIAQKSDSIEIPVGSKIFSGWYFTDPTRPANSCGEEDVCPVGDPCCGDPCCEFQPRWPAVYEIVAQSMTLDTYRYWESIEKLNSNNGLVLDTYPFPIEGNVTCENCRRIKTTGLFRVVYESRKRISIVL